MTTDYIYKNKFKPLLKWPGGKSSEIDYIKDNFRYLLPEKIDNYFEPFLGGGAFWLSLNVNKMFVNDLSEDLIKFYLMIKEQNKDFFNIINNITKNWNYLHVLAVDEGLKVFHNNDYISKAIEKIKLNFESEFFSKRYIEDSIIIISKHIFEKIKRIHNVEQKTKQKLSDDYIIKNIECAFKSGLYIAIRNIYNKHEVSDELKISCFYFLRDYSFSSMFRFNRNGDFNVPYGGISYNQRDPNARLSYWNDNNLIKHLNKTNFSQMDFEDFLKFHKPSSNDFIFFDPPYDTVFSTYDKNIFAEKDQIRLANFLKTCPASFLAIMKDTEFIREIYNHKNINILSFNKNYTVSFKNRNIKDVKHLIISKN
jgi:DNA adenine methylase